MNKVDPRQIRDVLVDQLHSNSIPYIDLTGLPTTPRPDLIILHPAYPPFWVLLPFEGMEDRRAWLTDTTRDWDGVELDHSDMVDTLVAYLIQAKLPLEKIKLHLRWVVEIGDRRHRFYVDMKDGHPTYISCADPFVTFSHSFLDWATKVAHLFEAQWRSDKRKEVQ